MRLFSNVYIWLARDTIWIRCFKFFARIARQAEKCDQLIAVVHAAWSTAADTRKEKPILASKMLEPKWLRTAAYDPLRRTDVVNKAPLKPENYVRNSLLKQKQASSFLPATLTAVHS